MLALMDAIVLNVLSDIAHNEPVDKETIKIVREELKRRYSFTDQEVQMIFDKLPELKRKPQIRMYIREIELLKKLRVRQECDFKTLKTLMGLTNEELYWIIKKLKRANLIETIKNKNRVKILCLTKS